MKAILLNKASEKIRTAIKNAELEIKNSEDSIIKSMVGAQLVLKKIKAGHTGLHDPKNATDMLILEVASWE